MPDNSIWLTKEKYDNLTSGDKYWRNRWEYHKAAIALLSMYQIESTVEIGSNGVKLYNNGISVDKSEESNPDILYDCSYDFQADTEADAVIALQVLEHLKDPKRVLKDMMDRSRTVTLISIPYKWENSISEGHNGLDDDTVIEWADGHKWQKRWIIGNRGLYLWEK